VKPDPLQPELSGLKQLEYSLPSSWYFDPAQHALELERIWYRNWIYLCRADSIAAARHAFARSRSARSRC
jgi:Rieske 2Fe-2S family protein